MGRSIEKRGARHAGALGSLCSRSIRVRALVVQDDCQCVRAQAACFHAQALGLVRSNTGDLRPHHACPRTSRAASADLESPYAACRVTRIGIQGLTWRVTKRRARADRAVLTPL